VLNTQSETSSLIPVQGIGVDHGQRRRLVTESLLAEIFQGKIQAGKHLVIKDLADRFEVSPTPVREALVALEGIGIVDLVPNRGAVVRKVSAVEVKEICQVRKALECEATRSACGRIELAQLHDLAEQFRRMQATTDPTDMFLETARQLDSRLHDLIADSCPNRFLGREISRLKLLFRAFRDVAWEWKQANDDYHRYREEAREHLAIVECLLKGESKPAARAMAWHIRSGVKYWSRALEAF
jgi:DNA-binding GntR family transcriptional regulator